ncbi:MAG: HAMP domain-containing histidine kinase [Desulfobacteraceae bacterium]|nr:HAMP domain-containing histidine kinase [Desulfobacteraceae bacterium]
MKIKFGITSKLMMLFFVLIFIFYGTLLVLYVNVQKLMQTSQQIISINNQVTTISKGMLDNLISMDVNHKKFNLLKKQVYLNYFKTANKNFCEELDKIIKLDSRKYPLAGQWQWIHQSFTENTTNAPKVWVEDNLMSKWIETISNARKDNQEKIEQALIKINDLGRQSVRNSLLGLLLSIIAGILGAVFISKSMIRPIKKLKHGLNNISNDNYHNFIEINSKDEFSELATAFNTMSRQLKENDDIRSDFIAILSHEIRTPLSSIRESVNMIIEKVFGPVNDNQKKFLKIASSEINRINDLLDHLLDVSMLESNSGKITPGPIDPNLLLKEVSNSLISKGKINDVNIRLHKLSDAPMVMGVKKEVIQVLLNIVYNAIKFSDTNSFVDIYLLNQKNNNELTFKISDQGPGVPEEEQPLIFKKYYRAKKMRNNMDGVGLGLSISKRIIHAHGGIIYMENNKDKGCSFFFTLPKTNEQIIKQG